MLSFLKTFERIDINKYSTIVRNTTVTFILHDATSMKHNAFRIVNDNIGATLYGVELSMVEAVINITDPIEEENKL